MNNLKKQYNEEVVPAMMKKFGCKNRFAVPAVKKIVLNVGISAGLKDKEFTEAVKNTLARISGQKPVETKSRKSISNFKIKEGMVIGVKVTLRGSRMWDFLEKLIKVTLPRVRDFRGLSAGAFDKSGNFSLGFKEYIAFPEIRQDEIEKVHGLQVCIAMTAKNVEESKELLRLLGMPFK